MKTELLYAIPSNYIFPDYDEELAYAQARDVDDVQNREERYRDDPLKVLSRFFEKEGFDMEFSYEETGTGQNHKWTCSIESVYVQISYLVFTKIKCNNFLRFDETFTIIIQITC